LDFWYPLEHVVMFKRGVYARALRHLAPLAREVAGAGAIPLRERQSAAHGCRQKRAFAL